MPRIQFVSADGSVVEAEATDGQSLMQAAVNAGVNEIFAECGGSCSCGTCHCYVDAAWAERLPPPGPNEAAMIECVVNPKPESRLSCQVRLSGEHDGLVVHLPASQY